MTCAPKPQRMPAPLRRADEIRCTTSRKSAAASMAGNEAMRPDTPLPAVNGRAKSSARALLARDASGYVRMCDRSNSSYVGCFSWVMLGGGYSRLTLAVPSAGFQVPRWVPGSPFGSRFRVPRSVPGSAFRVRFRFHVRVPVPRQFRFRVGSGFPRGTWNPAPGTASIRSGASHPRSCRTGIPRPLPGGRRPAPGRAPRTRRPASAARTAAGGSS